MRIVKLKEVMGMTGLGRSTIYKLQQEGRFPKGIKLSERAVGWIAHEVEAYMQEKLDARDAGRDHSEALSLLARQYPRS